MTHLTTIAKRLLLALLLLLTPAAGAQDVYSAPVLDVPEHSVVPPVPEDWKTVYGPFLRFHGHPADYPILLHLSRHAADRLPALATDLGVPIGDTIHVYLVPTKEQFRTLQPGNAPSWADGVAYPSLGVIYLHSPRARDGTATPIEKVLDHELVHIILGRAFHPNPTPQWLQEGVAQVWAGEFTPDTTRRLAEGMLGGGLLGLSTLDRGFPRDPVRAQLAYAQSADLIAWLRVRYGDEAIGEIVRSMAAGKTIDAAVYAATGQFLDDVDREWRARLETGTPLSITALTGEPVWWSVGAVILLVGGFLRRRQFKRRLAEMEAEEALIDELVAQVRAEERASNTNIH